MTAIKTELTTHWVGENYHQHSDQQEAVAKALLQRIRFQQNDHILDVGCGDGKITSLISQSVPEGQVIGLDPSSSMLKTARSNYEGPNLQFQLAKASEIDADEVYDVITSFSALHWEPKQKEALFAFKRALKPGGKIVLAIPGPDFTLRSTLKELTQTPAWSHFFEGFESPGKVWEISEYGDLLKEVGFEIKRLEWVERPYVYPNDDSYKKFLQAILPHLSRVSLEKKDQFIQEIVDRLKEKGHVDGLGRHRHDVRVIEVIAHNTRPPTIWAEIRNLFELDPTYIHLGLGMVTPHPRPVRQAIERHRNGFDRNPTLYYRNKEPLENEVLEAASRYLETKASQIALTESTTMGLGVVLSGIQMERGEQILATAHEHYAAQELLRFKEKREGIEVHRIALYENASTVTDDSVLERLLSQITEKTRLILLTWVHSSTGVKLPIQKIAKALKLVNAARPPLQKILLALDGLHGFGVEELSVETLGCDFFIAGCHKWLFGPRGTGIVWGTEEGWKRIVPIITSFKGEAFFAWYKSKNPDEECPPAWLCSPGGFPAFEHRWALSEAFHFHLGIGKKMISERISQLATLCKKHLTTIPRLRLHTPLSPALSSGMVCFEIEGMDPGVVVEELIKRRVLSGQTPYRGSLCRFTPGILNTEDDMNGAAIALREIVSV